MVHADKLENVDMREPEFFLCPICGSPLSLLRRVNGETEELAILVTCEFCDEYHGFVILTGLQEEDLEKFIEYRKRPMRARIEGYDWEEELEE